MPVMLDSVVCQVVEPDGQACLAAPLDGEGPPRLAIDAEGGEIVWRFEGLSLGEPPARPRGRSRGEGADSRVVFHLAKDALLGQRDLFPLPQAQAKADYALEGPIRGEERWSGRGRPVEEPIATFALTRAFVACPEPVGFVADTPEPPVLRLAWSLGGGGAAEAVVPQGGEGGTRPRLDFAVEMRCDVAPDRRWSVPALEIAMTHQTYADLMAALDAIE